MGTFRSQYKAALPAPDWYGSGRMSIIITKDIFFGHPAADSLYRIYYRKDRYMKRTFISAMLACAAAAFIATGCASDTKPAETAASTVAESTEKPEETNVTEANKETAEGADQGEADTETGSTGAAGQGTSNPGGGYPLADTAGLDGVGAGPTEIISGSGDQADGSNEISDYEYYVPNPVSHFGTILSADTESGDISINVIQTTESGELFEQEVIFHSISSVPIVDAMTGLPVGISELTEGQTVYAWSSQAMTMSIPAQTSLQAMVVNVPEDAGSPAYVVAAEAEYDEAKGSLSITDQDGNTYTAIDGEADIQPFKTRNIVTLKDVTAGSRLMIWDNVTKIVLF